MSISTGGKKLAFGMVWCFWRSWPLEWSGASGVSVLDFCVLLQLRTPFLCLWLERMRAGKHVNIHRWKEAGLWKMVCTLVQCLDLFCSLIWVSMSSSVWQKEEMDAQIREQHVNFHWWKGTTWKRPWVVVVDHCFGSKMVVGFAASFGMELPLDFCCIFVFFFSVSQFKEAEAKIQYMSICMRHSSWPLENLDLVSGTFYGLLIFFLSLTFRKRPDQKRMTCVHLERPLEKQAWSDGFWHFGSNLEWSCLWTFAAFWLPSPLCLSVQRSGSQKTGHVHFYAAQQLALENWDLVSGTFYGLLIFFLSLSVW